MVGQMIGGATGALEEDVNCSRESSLASLQKTHAARVGKKVTIGQPEKLTCG